MKIIKDGDKTKLLRTKHFECKGCGCIFEANKDEYERYEDYQGTFYFMDCPCCGNKVYADKNICIREPIRC